MYLSRLLLDPASRQVQRELANRYELHRTLCAQFQDARRDEIGLLYRLDNLDIHEYQPITLLVQTQLQPVWDQLLKTSFLLKPAETKMYEPHIVTGLNFRFRLLANPTMRCNKGKYEGKRVELQTLESQTDWLVRKGDLGGFRIIGSNAQNLGKIVSSKHQGRLEEQESSKRMTITHQAVLFEGYLEVVDVNSFQLIIRKGIGSAKAFGFGLLSIAPIV